MQLLLTSNWLRSHNLLDFYKTKFKFNYKPRLYFMFTITSNQDWNRIPYYKDEFENMWVDYTFQNISESVDLSLAKWYDIYYVWWWNTYYILQRLRITWLDKILIDEINNKKLYIWLSAWSIIAWPNIDISHLWPDWDKNNIWLKDLTWFKIVDKIVFPHYITQYSNLIKEYSIWNPEYEIIKIMDLQMVYSDWEKFEVIW